MADTSRVESILDELSNEGNGHDHDHDTRRLPTVEPGTKSGPPPSSSSSSQRLKQYLTRPVSSTSVQTSVLLLLLALATGINDAATFMDYHLFVSNQTGNTIFLGVGALARGTTVIDLRHVGVSLGLFLAGGLVSGQTSTRLVHGKRTRWWIGLSNTVQTSLTFAAAGLRQWYATTSATTSDPDAGGARDLSVVALLAFASGMQVAMARGLGVPEIPTGMITSAWIDLVALDERPWRLWRANPARDRRLAFVLCILVGGFVGAGANAYCAPALPLFLAACVKAVATVGFLVSAVDADANDDKTEAERRSDRSSTKREIESAKITVGNGVVSQIKHGDRAG